MNQYETVFILTPVLRNHQRGELGLEETGLPHREEEHGFL